MKFEILVDVHSNDGTSLDPENVKRALLQIINNKSFKRYDASLGREVEGEVTVVEIEERYFVI